jgi:hypothetical protein
MLQLVSFLIRMSVVENGRLKATRLKAVRCREVKVPWVLRRAFMADCKYFSDKRGVAFRNGNEMEV